MNKTEGMKVRENFYMEIVSYSVYLIIKKFNLLLILTDELCCILLHSSFTFIYEICV